VDRFGNEYELKTVNLDRQSPSFTTHHHLNLGVLDKYRQVDWIFATYKGITIGEIYYVPPGRLEDPYFQRWEGKLQKRDRQSGPDETPDLNNPKIAIGHVRRVGNQLYPEDGQAEFNF
jgi:type II restriction enzyme